MVLRARYAFCRSLTWFFEFSGIIEEDQFLSPSSRISVEALFASRKGHDNYVDFEFVDYKGATSFPLLTIA